MIESGQSGVLWMDAILCAMLLWASAMPAWSAEASARPAERKTGLVYSPVYLEHETAPSHPEQAVRLEAIMRRLKESGLTEKLQLIEPREAEERWLTAIHSPRYIARAKAACADGDAYLDTGDVSICPRSCDVAIKAAGGVLAAVDAVMEGRAANAFCAIRPPGHHAMKDQAMGFCIFNNIAIAARYIQNRHKLQRVLIVDWDVHHGNGTQAAFNDDPTVFYFSIHRSPFYPGTGEESETGTGKGKGTKLNITMRAGAGDADYINAVNAKLIPAAKQFKPDFVLVSAGFDAHEVDPLGGMKLTSGCYGQLTRIVKQIADESCGGRLVAVLEGGYNPRALGESVEAHIRVLMERK